MLSLSFKKFSLQFKVPVLTSRGEMAFKNGFFIKLYNYENEGIGECSFIEGLSVENPERVEQKLSEIAAEPDYFLQNKHLLLQHFPAVVFGLETAWKLFQSLSKNVLFESDYTKGKLGIPINGLVWMGDASFMQKQIEEKLEQGFRCIKLKVGALDFGVELKLIEGLRKRYGSDKIELRLDANGAFAAEDVFEKLEKLSDFEIHSIEQPVRQGQWDLMREVAESNIIPVALDEELIGIQNPEERTKLLEKTKPHYIILKPSLLGGFASCDAWIELAEKQNIGWWATSALESNVGLNAIAQWVATKKINLPQGLGTGGLFLNNTPACTEIKNGCLWFLDEENQDIISTS